MALVFVTVVGLTAALGGAAGASFADSESPTTAETTGDAGPQTANNDSGHDHSDGPPENNDNPDDPPCDADHGHPANNSEECDDDDPGNSGNDSDNGDNGQNGDENNGNETGGDDGNGTDDNTGNETDGTLGTCEQGGAFQNNTVANEAFGTENESGPISSGVHENEEQFQDLEPVVHEGSCVVATVDNNAQQEAQSDGATAEQDGVETDSEVADVGV